MSADQSRKAPPTDPVMAALPGLLQELMRHAVVELDVTVGDARLYVRQRPGSIPAISLPGSRVAGSTSGGTGPAESAAAGLVAIKSPLAGMFYASPAPDEAPYVRVGDTVEVGQVVALVEAMKVFNEIHSDVAGVVSSVLATAGQLVQNGQPLILLHPAPNDSGGERLDG